MSGEKKNKSDWNFFLPIFIRDIGLSHSHSLSNEIFMKNEEEILFQFFFVLFAFCSLITMQTSCG